jgi:4a-hydroxytetrahydrobiopterin dehydratase
MITPLSQRHCQRDTELLEFGEAKLLLADIHTDWSLADDARSMHRSFSFKNYYQTMAFVNALAYVAHAEDHHPDLEVSYNRCVVRYATHSVGGLSENDFICAARIDALVDDAA